MIAVLHQQIDHLAPRWPGIFFTRAGRETYVSEKGVPSTVTGPESVTIRWEKPVWRQGERLCSRIDEPLGPTWGGIGDPLFPVPSQLSDRARESSGSEFRGARRCGDVVRPGSGRFYRNTPCFGEAGLSGFFSEDDAIFRDLSFILSLPVWRKQ